MAFVDIPAPHGRLEGFVWKVESPVAAVVVCHPHPLQGGTMHNHVAYRIAAAFRDAGVTALRFNFRGVGRSTGSFDEGRGEVDDARAALDYLSQLEPNVPLLIAGFSFGSRVSLRLCTQDRRIDRCLVAGLAVALYDYEFAREVKIPKAIIQSEHDEYGALEQVRALVATLPPPVELFVVRGADHLCHNQLKALELAARDAVSWLMKQKGHPAS